MRNLKFGITVLTLMALLPLASAVLAQPTLIGQVRDPAAAASGFDLSWWTVDGGGQTGGGAGYTLGGTIGQLDAKGWFDNQHTIAGGFWGGVAVQYRVFLPLVLRSF